MRGPRLIPQMKQLEKEKSKALSSLVAKNAAPVKELEDKDVSFESQMEKLKSNFVHEKAVLQDASYTEDFRGYLKRFIAADPNYDWAASFRAQMAAWIAEFKLTEAGTIAAKKLELDQQKAVATKVVPS